jgi:hypothetical protein
LSGVKERLARGEAFLDAFKDASGNLPAIGDGDDGYAVAPGITPVRAQCSSVSPPHPALSRPGRGVPGVPTEV